MKPLSSWAFVAALCTSISPQASAAELVTPELPPLAQVRPALLKAPEVLAAQALIGAEQANQRRLEAGNSEWLLRLTGQRRQVRPEPAQGFSEWDVAIERNLRLPGKARLDTELGAQGVSLAQTAHGDALHEAGRGLLKAWFIWLREKSSREQWDQQVATLSSQAKATARRVQLGDAARLDSMTAEAALAQAQAAAHQAKAKEVAAATDLRQRYPDILLPEKLLPPEPALPEGGMDAWLEQVITQSHELNLARAEAGRVRLLAARADADRTPDPTLGLRHASERGGEERITGLVLSIPLSGTARQAGADAAQAQARAAAQREAGALRKIRAETLSLISNLEAQCHAWQASRDAAQRLQQVADLTLKAQQLGEAGLSEVLTSRRLAHEAALNERLSRLDALESRRRLELDAHRLWDLDEE